MRTYRDDESSGNSILRRQELYEVQTVDVGCVWALKEAIIRESLLYAYPRHSSF
jgi:hypothetical protein